MTASKNANNAAAAGGAGGGGGGSTSATTSDGDYRLMPHEVINSPTTSYEVYNIVIILGLFITPLPSVLRRCCLGGRKFIRPVKN